MPTIYRNTGKSPRDKNARIVVRFRNGRISDAYTVGQLRWEPWPSGESDWDVYEYWRGD